MKWLGKLLCWYGYHKWRRLHNYQEQSLDGVISNIEVSTCLRKCGAKDHKVIGTNKCYHY